MTYDNPAIDRIPDCNMRSQRLVRGMLPNSGYKEADGSGKKKATELRVNRLLGRVYGVCMCCCLEVGTM